MKISTQIEPRKVDGSDIAETISKMRFIPLAKAQKMVDEYQSSGLRVRYLDSQPSLKIEAVSVIDWYNECHSQKLYRNRCY